jgi:hypothetical protein
MALLLMEEYKQTVLEEELLLRQLQTHREYLLTALVVVAELVAVVGTPLRTTLTLLRAQVAAVAEVLLTEELAVTVVTLELLVESEEMQTELAAAAEAAAEELKAQTLDSKLVAVAQAAMAK